MSIVPDAKLTDKQVLVFDVYGTLMDWETGIYNALKPLLSKYEAAGSWSKKEALNAFGSVEIDLQSQFPDMPYSVLLIKVHEVLEQRLKALSSQSATVHPQLAPSTVKGESSGASTSADAAGTTIQSLVNNEDNMHAAFGDSIKHWPIFPDTASALKRLSRHFKLTVLSNVDRQSFQHTHATLSEGGTSLDITPYLYPSNNPNKFWHPKATPGSNSPFTVIATAQDTGSYKPALGGFQALLEYIQSNTDLLGGESLDDVQVKSKVLVVAQSLPHDHVPAKQLGINSVWIDRQSAVTCNTLPGGQSPWTWRVETLGELADIVEKEFGRLS